MGGRCEIFIFCNCIIVLLCYVMVSNGKKEEILYLYCIKNVQYSIILMLWKNGKSCSTPYSNRSGKYLRDKTFSSAVLELIPEYETQWKARMSQGEVCILVRPCKGIYWKVGTVCCAAVRKMFNRTVPVTIMYIKYGVDALVQLI